MKYLIESYHEKAIRGGGASYSPPLPSDPPLLESSTCKSKTKKKEIVQMAGTLYVYIFIKKSYISRSMDSCKDGNRAAMTLCKKYGMRIFPDRIFRKLGI